MPAHASLHAIDPITRPLVAVVTDLPYPDDPVAIGERLDLVALMIHPGSGARPVLKSTIRKMQYRFRPQLRTWFDLWGHSAIAMEDFIRNFERYAAHQLDIVVTDQLVIPREVWPAN